MNKYLPDNIDEFFVSHLESYSEEPEEDVWNEIDKRLSAEQNNKRSGYRCYCYWYSCNIIGLLMYSVFNKRQFHAS